MVLHRTDTAAERQPDSYRKCLVALKSRVHLGQLRNDLVEGRVDETIELNFGYRDKPGLCQTNGSTDDA